MTDIISQNENKDDFEDGELPEDGEICDDEDESVKAVPSKSSESAPGAHIAPAHPEKTSGRDSRERVRRFEGNSPPRERDPDPFGSHNDAPDGNDYFGGDKDYRSGAAASSEEEPFSDTDYRVNRRRRLSPSHDDGDFDPRSKRPYYGGRGGFRGGFRNGAKPRFQTEHQICKFFREGYCRDGDNCLYSHQAEDSLRRPVLCNFYANSFCKKGLQCLMLHGEFPCKSFHKGQCNHDPCRFSHVPLTDYTRPIIEKILADEEARQAHQAQQAQTYRQNPVANAAAAAAAAQVMPRRRVLLPGGPNMNGSSPPHATPVIHAPIPQASHPSQLPPPAVVVPTIQRNPGPGIPIHQQYPVAPAAGGYFNQGPRPEQVQGLPPPRTIEPPRLSTQTPPIMHQQQPQLMRPMHPVPIQHPHLQQPGLVQPPQIVSQERHTASPQGFNLEAMLNKMANGEKLISSPRNNVVDDSPASPPPSNYSSMFGSSNRVAVIPQTVQVTWGLVRVQRRLPYSNVENPDRIAANDPRRAKAIAKQFDAFSSLLGAGGNAVSDPRLRAQKEKNDRQQNTMPFSSWMPQIS